MERRRRRSTRNAKKKEMEKTPHQPVPVRSQTSAFNVPVQSAQAQAQASSFRQIGTTVVASSGTVPMPTASSSTRPKPCSCNNSRCLQKYCECFRLNQFCRDCNCINCHNNPEHARERQKAVQKALGKDKNAFQFPPSAMGGQVIGGRKFMMEEFRGCKCRKSHCLKKYCDCFDEGVHCGPQCKCLECGNQPRHAHRAGAVSGMNIEAFKYRAERIQRDRPPWSDPSEESSLNSKYAKVLNTSKTSLSAVIDDNSISTFCFDLSGVLKDEEGNWQIAPSSQQQLGSSSQLDATPEVSDDLLCTEDSSSGLTGNTLFQQQEAAVLLQTEKFLKKLLAKSQRVPRVINEET